MGLNQEIINITDAIRQAVPTEKIYLFGSYAYGIPDEDSDYDFFVVISDDGPHPLEAAQKARRSLLNIDRKTPVDILAGYRSSFDSQKHYNTLERKIFREGVMLYERI